MIKKTLEKFLRDNKGIDGEFRLKINIDNTAEEVLCYIHPMGRDGESMDFIVTNDNIEQIHFEKVE